MINPSSPNQLYDLLRPVKTKKIRLGPKADSGYVVAKDYLPNNLFSYGVGPSCDFEADYINLVPNCSVALFDGTVRAPTNFLDAYPNATFYNNNVYTLDHLGLALQTEQSVFVAMDIEGSEFTVFKNTETLQLENIISKIQQLCIEVHLENKDYIEIFQLLHLFQQHFYLVHIHGNNHRKQTIWNLPICIELTYINKSCFLQEVVYDNTPCPVEGLDYPCEPFTEDLSLNWWC